MNTPASARRRPSLGTWLFISVTAVMVAVVLTCTLVIDAFMRDHARRHAELVLQVHAEALRDALDRGMAQHFEEVQVVARLDQVAQGSDPAAVRRVLDQLHTSFPLFTWIGLADERGRIVAANDGLLEGADVSQRPWFAGARQRPYVGDVHPAVLLEKRLPAQAEPWRFVDVATPIADAEGRVRGVLGMHLSWAWAGMVKRELVDVQIERYQAQALIVSAHDVVLLGDVSTQGKPLPALPGEHLQALSLTRGSGRYAGLGWKVVLRQPEAVALADFRLLERRVHLAALVLCVMLAPLMWLLARRLAIPLWRLRAALESGQTLQPAGRPLYREEQVLGDALARYAEHQARDQAELRELNATLQQRVAERTAALADSEQKLREVADNMPALIACFDSDERCLFANATAMRLHGLTPETMAVATLRSALAERYEEHRPHIAKALSGQRTSFEGQALIGGSQLDFFTYFVPRRDAGGAIVGLYVLSQDQTALKAAERRLRTIADNLPALIAYIDRDQRIRFCNETYRSWLGQDPGRIVGQTVREVLGEEQHAAREPLLRRALAGERCDFDSVLEIGSIKRHLHLSYLPDLSAEGHVQGLYALGIDISEMKAAELQLQRMARTDALTGLPNRLAFNERLESALARSRRQRQSMALLFLDVDKFKSINDTWGHAAGDEVLRTFARRLLGCVRETDTVARLAGDEFVVILEGLHRADESQAIARKIIESINRPLDVAGTTLTVGTSIGVAFETDGHAQAESMLARADQALYQAKRQRNHYCMAEPG